MDFEFIKKLMVPAQTKIALIIMDGLDLGCSLFSKISSLLHILGNPASDFDFHTGQNSRRSRVPKVTMTER